MPIFFLFFSFFYKPCTLFGVKLHSSYSGKRLCVRNVMIFGFKLVLMLLFLSLTNKNVSRCNLWFDSCSFKPNKKIPVTNLRWILSDTLSSYRSSDLKENVASPGLSDWKMKNSFEKVLVKPVFFRPFLFYFFLSRVKDLAMNCTATLTHLKEVNCLKNETSWCLRWLISKKNTIFDRDTSCVTEANKTILLQVLYQQDAVMFSNSPDM